MNKKSNYKLVIIDGTQLFIRYFSADSSVDQFGNPCGGLSGTLKGIRHIIKELTPDEIIIVFDGKDNSKRKQAIDDQYKKGRNMSYVELLPQDNRNAFTKQLSKLYSVLSHLPIKVLNPDNVEADDVVGYIIHSYNKLNVNVDKIIVSRDGDFKQLLSDDCIIFDMYKKKIYTYADFLAENGYHACNFHIFKTFAGESAGRDNIPRIFNKSKIMKYFTELLMKKTVVHYVELEQFIKDNKIEVDIDRVRKNYDLVCLHTPNISTTSKSELNKQIRMYSKKVYGMTNLRVQAQVFGIQSHVYDDFYTYMNLYKIKNNLFSNYMIENENLGK